MKSAKALVREAFGTEGESNDRYRTDSGNIRGWNIRKTIEGGDILLITAQNFFVAEVERLGKKVNALFLMQYSHNSQKHNVWEFHRPMKNALDVERTVMQILQRPTKTDARGIRYYKPFLLINTYMDVPVWKINQTALPSEKAVGEGMHKRYVKMCQEYCNLVNWVEGPDMKKMLVKEHLIETAFDERQCCTMDDGTIEDRYV